MHKGSTGEEPSSFPQVPGLMLALQRFGGESPATSVSDHSQWRVYRNCKYHPGMHCSGKMLKPVEANKETWIYMGLPLADTKVFWRSSSECDKGNTSSNVLPAIQAAGLPNAGSAAGGASPQYQQDQGEGLPIYQMRPDTAEPTSCFKQVKSCPAYNAMM